MRSQASRQSQKKKLSIDLTGFRKAYVLRKKAELMLIPSSGSLDNAMKRNSTLDLSAKSWLRGTTPIWRTTMEQDILSVTQRSSC